MDASCARSHIEGCIFKYPFGDIIELRKRDINAGYPITLLVMVCIEAISTVLYKPGKRELGQVVRQYFMEYMSRVKSEYGVEFNKSRPVGKKKNETSWAIGDILWKFLRCQLGHSANAIPGLSVDARSNTYHLHMGLSEDKGIFIHAYALFDDFRASLEHLYRDIASNEIPFKDIAEGLDYYFSKVKDESDRLKTILDSGAKLDYHYKLV